MKPLHWLCFVALLGCIKERDGETPQPKTRHIREAELLDVDGLSYLVHKFRDGDVTCWVKVSGEGDGISCLRDVPSKDGGP